MPAGPTLWICQNWRKLTNVCKKTGQSPEDRTDSRSPCESSDWGVTLKYKGNKLCLPMKELSVFGGVQTPDPSKNQMFVWKNCQRTASSLEGSSGTENHQCRVHIPDRYPEVLSLEKERTACPTVVGKRPYWEVLTRIKGSCEAELSTATVQPWFYKHSPSLRAVECLSRWTIPLHWK
jgi:hypothetical protein